MQNLSPFRQLQLTYLGRIYAFTYITKLKKVFGFRISSLLTGGSLGLFLISWIFNWAGFLIILLLLLAIGIRIVYWRANRAGYSKFIEDKTAVFPSSEFPQFPPNEHIKFRASGKFAISSREDSVLLRPAEYWKIPLGDHIVMVEQAPGYFLYQFFNEETIEAVQAGSLIFGHEPHRALSVTFCSKWGPEFNDLAQFYYVKNGTDAPPPCNKRTIYLTFANEEEQTAVWHSITNN
ncbi:MAG: hypothetical protein GY943_36685 [Chloroflexi bacterium]|nr:hypothetical protein [Chloroflexota bacterium]